MRYFCECLKFKLWYEQDGVKVCWCGHRDAEHLDAEHLDGERSCVGDVERG